MSWIMTRRARRVAGVGALVVTALLPASMALARPPIGDDPPVPPTLPEPEPPAPAPEPEPEPAPQPPPSPSPGPGVPRREPRFVVQAIRVRANDESGVDWLGSDEVYAVWAADGVMAASELFGDVDTGETRSFGVTERCILPIEPIVVHGTASELASEAGDTWRCVQAGHAAPVQFNVRLWESDSDWEFWEWGCFRRDGNLPPANCPDDLIGEFTQTFNENELLFALPQPGMWFEATKTLGSACGYNVCGPGPTGPEYTFTYRVTRMADYQTVLAPPG
jgi:hypothetical protein